MNIGLIGTGYWGPNYIRSVISLYGKERITIYDKNKSAMENASSVFGVAKANNLSEIRNKCDHIIIATPPSSHFDLIEEFEGKKILVEKPATISLNQWMSIKNDNVMVGYTYLFNPYIEYVKGRTYKKGKEIYDKELGKLLYMRSERMNIGIIRKDVPVHYDLATHDLAIMLSIAFGGVAEADCKIKTRFVSNKISKGQHPEICSVFMNIPNGIFCESHVSWMYPVKTRKISFVFENGAIIFEESDRNEPIKILKESNVPTYTLMDYAQFLSITNQYEKVIPSIFPSEPLKNQITSFVDGNDDSYPKNLCKSKEFTKTIQSILERCDNINVG